MGESPVGDSAKPESGVGSAAVAAPGLPRESRKQAQRGGSARKMGESSDSDRKRGGPQARRSPLQVYKRTQGTYTRWGTFAGSGILILAGAHFVHEQLSVFVDPAKTYTLWIQKGIPLMLIAGLGLLVYWIAFVNRKACDFMIATEGEMKKVNWSSRREIVGSTKVVIAFTLLLTLILFVVDMIFMMFFSWIGVLREAPSLWQFVTGGGT
ncbi:MAG TPA: preprotein translocase subunit SecE [Phycisphaerae bacterium]|nr:preprotein translocase subunit SecE [Phycisphaerae bacterium]